MIEKAGRFVACEMIEGDYLEFGVFRGDSFIQSYHQINKQFSNRILQDLGGEQEERSRQIRERIWEKMRFFAFDSFEGLPALTPEDAKSNDFKKGQYKFELKDFVERVVTSGVPKSRVTPVRGWFSETCNEKTRTDFGMEKAAIIWIDCDLYSSTKDVLRFVEPLLQDGTVLIFDDWYSYKGSPFAGEQRAFNEWIANLRGRFTFAEYHKEDWKRCSFIVTSIPEGQSSE